MRFIITDKLIANMDIIDIFAVVQNPGVENEYMITAHIQGTAPHLNPCIVRGTEKEIRALFETIGDCIQPLYPSVKLRAQVENESSGS